LPNTNLQCVEVRQAANDRLCIETTKQSDVLTVMRVINHKVSQSETGNTNLKGQILDYFFI